MILGSPQAGAYDVQFEIMFSIEMNAVIFQNPVEINARKCSQNRLNAICK